MNLAAPPLDDIHVRRALNLAIDKNGMRVLRGGPLVGSVARHIFPDSMEDNLLLHFNPDPTPGDRGSLVKAMAEMAKSKYDTNHDGICDAAACKGILTVMDENPPYPNQTNLIAQDLKPLGMTLTVGGCDRSRSCSVYAICADPTKHAALCPSVAWAKDYPDGYTFGPPLFGRTSIGSTNYGLVGADSSLLKKDGYKVTEVPSIEPQLKHCEGLAGDPRIHCWADLDRYLMEKVVPIVPLQFDKTVNVLAKRVHCYSYDQFAAEVALDHLCLTS